MKSRALSVAVLFVSALATAQVRVATEIPFAPALRASVAAPSFAAPSPSVAPAFASPSLAAPSPAVAPALSALPAASLAAAPSAAPAAAPALAATPAASIETAKSVVAGISAAPEKAAPALNAAFDGTMAAASVPVDASAPLTPEQFALRGRELFAEAVRAESARSSGVGTEAVATDDEMRGRMDRLPTTNPEREKYIVELFKLAGARPDEIVLQDIGRGRHNIMVVKKGRTDRVIVVGGHHDKVSEGAGSIDNGTGSTMVANLYQALRDQDTDATIVFVAFGREEEGLLGSEAYLRSLTPAQKSKIDAMVNLDTLAVNGTFSWRNNSTRAMLDRVAQVAREKHRDLQEAHLDGGDADSSSFRQAGIPAITIYGASEDVIFDIIHSGRDTMAAFDLGHYRNAYLLTLDFVKSLDKKKLGPVGEGNI